MKAPEAHELNDHGVWGFLQAVPNQPDYVRMHADFLMQGDLIEQRLLLLSVCLAFKRLHGHFHTGHDAGVQVEVGLRGIVSALM